MYNYLEAGSENPFDDARSRATPGKSPHICQVDYNTLIENTDTPAEITWGQKMTARRAPFLDKQMDIELRSKELLPPGKERAGIKHSQIKENAICEFIGCFGATSCKESSRFSKRS
jgi:hypothetical protein